MARRVKPGERLDITAAEYNRLLAAADAIARDRLSGGGGNRTHVRDAATCIVGDKAQAPVTTCGAEDFSYFMLQRPGCFFFVGAGLPGPVRPHHKSVFDFDEKALEVSASIFVQLIMDLIGPK